MASKCPHISSVENKHSSRTKKKKKEVTKSLYKILKKIK